MRKDCEKRARKRLIVYEFLVSFRLGGSPWVGLAAYVQRLSTCTRRLRTATATFT